MFLPTNLLYQRVLYAIGRVLVYPDQNEFLTRPFIIKNDVAVRESGRISELKCLELFEGIVPGFAVMQQNLKQHLVKVSRGWRVTET